MKKISVTASINYNVYVDSDILKNCGSIIKELKNPARAVIVSDDNVFPLYGDIVKASLEKEGFEVLSFVFPHGEASKTLNTATSILSFLADNKISRSDILVALGGGVVGDITGFCSAIFLRGISYVQIPTTVLAMVDSSVGGKTAVDMENGKNLIGAFKQPLTVLCDTDTINTLSDDIITDGLCEIIKYGCILDKNLFDLLKTGKFMENITDIIATCIQLKADVVAVDEFDTGLRGILNFGHTMGHAIELLSNFSLSHGKCVAKGMYYIEKANGSDFASEILDVLNVYNISIDCPFTYKEIAEKATSDKKIGNKTIGLIVLEEIGKSKFKTIPTHEMEEFFRKGFN